MVGQVEQIEQDIAALDQAVKTLAKEFSDAYASYLAAFGSAVRQQLILSVYHICTQGYPEEFLQLDVKQRQQFQDALRSLAQKAESEITALMSQPTVTEPEAADQESETLQSESAGADAILKLVSSTPTSMVRSLTPLDVAQWQEELEHQITHTLHNISHATNRLLQEENILPGYLPDQLIEAASKAEMSEVSASQPNLLSVLIEGISQPPPDPDEVDELKPESVVRILAVHLRLADIEFGDALTTAARSKLRNLVAQLKTLGRQYHKKQRERAIAQAQTAWRSTWYEA